MTLPLYRIGGSGKRQLLQRDPKGHAGLWFDKFCDRWVVDGTCWKMSSGEKEQSSAKQAWIDTVTNRPVGDGDRIEAYALRLLRLIRARDGRAEVFTTESRFVTGLGRSHPVENGFAWHAGLGAPFLPGNSVKGMVRSWAMTDADPRPDHATVGRVLGDAGKIGGVTFMDAVPLGPVTLETDVMTPHYQAWNDDCPPGDWRSPIPIPFLTTARGTSFLFGLFQGETATTTDLDTVSGWLRDAVAWSGGGAKTAVGYGRFRPDRQALERLKQQLEQEERERDALRERTEAMRSPEGRWRLELQGLSEEQVLDSVRIHLEKERIQDPLERQAFAHAVESAGYISSWSSGKKQDSRTTVGRKKLRERARLVQEAISDDSH
jgi:CRISPR-associated protein Cmr6